ncbi:MAG: hypothetical protein ACKVHU_02385 [Acidimicrobiales bacterium]
MTDASRSPKLTIRDRIVRAAATAGGAGIVALFSPALVTLTVAAVLFIGATVIKVRSTEQGKKAPRSARLAAIAAVAMVYVQLSLWVGPVFALIALVGLAVAIVVLGGDVS